MPNSFDDSDIKFPFGKHKDKVIELVPDSYLKWVIECCNIDETFKTILKDELNKRAQEGIVVHDDREEFYDEPSKDWTDV